MENISGKVENNLLTISMSGHIDSTNSPKVEEEINKLIEKAPTLSIVIDCQNLEYISSAGLRVILRLSKDHGDLKLINVASAVYEVFEMTGFSELIHVEKAYRTLSIEGCEIIGQGANGKVYRLDPDTIIKVYNNPDSLPEINRERELARKAFVLGIPTAIPYDVVKVGNGYGSVFELLNAKSFTKLLVADSSSKDKLIDLYVDLLKKIHSTTVEPGDLPDQKEVGMKWVNYLENYLPKDQYDKLVKLFNEVPDTHKMIHGDYHTKNIMLQNGEVLLIDMDTLAMGHPVFEISSMYLAFIGYGLVDPKNIQQFLGIDYDLSKYFFNESMKKYLNTTDQKRVDEVVHKAMVVGMVRMMRRTIKRIGIDSPEGKPLIEACKKNLTQLLQEVETLDF
jgi:anti-anti-sigma factor